MFSGLEADLQQQLGMKLMQTHITDLILQQERIIHSQWVRTSTGFAYNTVRSITWVMNNSGSTITYLAPNGSDETVGNDQSDFWVGNTRVFNDLTVTTPAQTISDLKFYWNSGSGNMTLDNFLITDPTATPPTMDDPTDLVQCAGELTEVTFTGATNYIWSNDNPAIGLAASGVGNISFNAADVTSPELATITVTPSNGNCAGTPQTFTITVNACCKNPTNGGTITVAQTICSGGDPVAFTSTGLPTGHTGTLEYKWQYSDVSPVYVWNEIASSNSATYDDATVLTASRWYRRLARVECSDDWSGAASSNVLEVTINEKPAIAAISAPAALCAGG